MSDGNCIIPIQRRLYELFDSRMLRRPIGAYDALTSAANRTTNPVQVAMIGNSGKKEKYQITYVPADCDPAYECDDEGAPGICSAGSSEDVTTDVKTIDNCVVPKNIQLTTAQFRDLCNHTPDDFVMAQITSRLDVGARKVNELIVTELCANAGCYATGDTDTRSLKLINETTNTPVFGATQQIRQVYQDFGMAFDPILIGGGTLNMWAYGNQYGGNSQGGSQFREPSMPVFYDNQLQGVCPPSADEGDTRETILSLAPGVAQFVNYLENVGEFQTNLGGRTDILSLYQQNVMYTKGVLEDPINGYMWDMSVTYDNCADRWIIHLQSKFDVWTMRLNACQDACFTGILKWGACKYTPESCTPILS